MPVFTDLWVNTTCIRVIINSDDAPPEGVNSECEIPLKLVCIDNHNPDLCGEVEATYHFSHIAADQDYMNRLIGSGKGELVSFLRDNYDLILESVQKELLPIEPVKFGVYNDEDNEVLNE